MEEEKNLHLDKPGKGKTQEQLKKHTVDAGFENKPVDRAMHILTMGDDVQKISIIQSLPQLATVDSYSTCNRIIPKIQQDLAHSSCEIQITTSRIFKVLLEGHVDVNLLQSIIQGIDAKDPNVSLSWGETMLAVIPTISEETLKNTILPIAKLKSAPNNTVTSKIFCSKLIGKICVYPKLKLIDVKKDILPLALSLCQDPSPDVRAAICSNLPSVAQGVGTNFVKTNLLPSLVELACDENCIVRGTSISTIVLILQHLDQDTKKQTMVPLIKQLCEKSQRKEDTTALVLSGEFGVLLNGIEKAIQEADVQYFLKSYKTFSQRGKSSNFNEKVDASKDVLCRERCARNLDMVLQFSMRTAPDQVPFVYGICKELAADPCYLVRRSIAANIASIAKTLGEQNKIMKNEIVRLLRDDAVEVLDLLLPNLSSLLLSLCDYGTLTYTVSNQMTMDIGRALFKCQTELSRGYNWRLFVEFLTQLECLPFCMPADFIHNNITPVLLDKVMNGKAKPIRIQAIRTLIVFLRFNSKPNQHKWLRDSLVKEVCQSNNCYTRMLYVHLCDAALEVYSEKYFIEYFLPPLLCLATDKISGVRYGFVMFSTKLKHMVTLQSDARTKQMIYDVLNKMEFAEKNHVVLDLIKLKKRDPPPKMVEVRLKMEQKKVQDEASGLIKRPVLTNAVVVTPPPAPKQAQTVATSEMSFLEQHFYIDAGVNLPNIVTTDEDCTVLQALSDLKSLDERVLEKLSTTNVTDDVKVNLRKIKSRIVQPKVYRNCSDDNKTKRHSSVISIDCFDKDKKVLNRRSLNIGPKETSKIPVCLKNKIKKTRANGISWELSARVAPATDNGIDYKKPENYTDAVKIKDVSSLPSLVRRPPSQLPTRKPN